MEKLALCFETFLTSVISPLLNILVASGVGTFIVSLFVLTLVFRLLNAVRTASGNHSNRGDDDE